MARNLYSFFGTTPNERYTIMFTIELKAYERRICARIVVFNLAFTNRYGDILIHRATFGAKVNLLPFFNQLVCDYDLQNCETLGDLRNSRFGILIYKRWRFLIYNRRRFHLKVTEVPSIQGNVQIQWCRR